MPFFGSLATIGRVLLVAVAILNAVTTLAGTGVAGTADTGVNLSGLFGIAVDSSGNVYTSETSNSIIRKIEPTGMIATVIAGNYRTSGSADGTGTNATFNITYQIALNSNGDLFIVDGFNSKVRKIVGDVVSTVATVTGILQGIALDSLGNTYVSGGNIIYKITSGGVVTTFAGNGAGFLDGSGTNALFNSPGSLAVDSANNVYVADFNNNRIRRIDTSGNVTTYAGTGTAGSLNTTRTSATFRSPWGVAFDSSGNLYVADSGNHMIRKIDTSGNVTTLAGSGIGAGTGTGAFANGTGTNASFNGPRTLTLDTSGNVYVGDSENRLIRRITSVGVVTTFSGTGTLYGYGNGPAQFSTPYGVATDWDGNLYVADSANQCIRKITPSGVTTTFAGNGSQTFANGTGTNASFNFPYGVAVDSTQNVYVSDSINYRIRKITPGGVVTTLAGSGTAATTNGTGAGASFNLPRGITVDLSGNVFVSEQNGHVVRRITSGGVVTTLAGTAGTLGSTDATGTAASFNRPFGVVADLFGNVYVSDTYNHRIRRITSDGIVTTLAGSTVGFNDGTGTNAQFNFPETISIDPLGVLYVAEEGGERIRKITPAGVVTTLAGTGSVGFANGTALQATFNNPHGIAVDRFKQAYVGDTGNHSIRKVPNAFTLPDNNGVVTTFVGAGSETGGFLDGSGIGATFNEPQGIGIDSVGNLYIGDQINMRVRKITPAGVVTTFAGNGTQSSIDGTGTNATFDRPIGIVVDSTGNLYVLQYGHRLRKITPDGVVTTLAGSSLGFNNGTGTNAQFNFPFDLAVDLAGFVYVADTNNHLIRKITPSGVVTTFAGSTAGYTDGTGTNTQFNYPIGIEIDLNNNLYVADESNHRIRKITPTGVVTTLAGSSQGFNNGTGTNANFLFPTGVTLDSEGNVYVADRNNYRIRKITPTGVVTTLAGNSTRFNINGTGTNASFGLPMGIAVDPSGTVYVSDRTYHSIRKIGTQLVQIPLNRAVVTTFAGSGTAGATDGTGTSATFSSPLGVAIDSVGTVYVADQNNNRIRKITPGGVVTTLAGQTTAGSTDGTGTNAMFSSPRGVAVDSAGNVYVADTVNHRIRKITPGGVVSTLAGSTSGFNNGTGTNATFTFSRAVAVDSAGFVYVSDTSNQVIRKITPAGVVTTFAGNGTIGATNGTGTSARFNNPFGIAVDSAGNVYVADRDNYLIRKISPLGVVTTLAGSGTAAFVDGTGTNASFIYLYGITVNSEGVVYVADQNAYRIRRISPLGVVTTLAGNGSIESTNGTGTNAMFTSPTGVAVDSGGIVYTTDAHRIRKIQ